MPQNASHISRKELFFGSLILLCMMAGGWSSCKTQKEAIKTEPEEELPSPIAYDKDSFPIYGTIGGHDETNEIEHSLIGIWQWQPSEEDYIGDMLSFDKEQPYRFVFTWWPADYRCYRGKSDLLFGRTDYRSYREVWNGKTYNYLIIDDKKGTKIRVCCNIANDTLWMSNDSPATRKTKASMFIKKGDNDSIVHSVLNWIGGDWEWGHTYLGGGIQHPLTSKSEHTTYRLHLDTEDMSYIIYKDGVKDKEGHFGIHTEPNETLRRERNKEEEVAIFTWDYRHNKFFNTTIIVTNKEHSELTLATHIYDEVPTIFFKRIIE